MSDFCLKHGPLSGCEGCSDERHEGRIASLEAEVLEWREAAQAVVDDRASYTSNYATRQRVVDKLAALLECQDMGEWVSVEDRLPPSNIGQQKYMETRYLVVSGGHVTTRYWREGSTITYWSSWDDEHVTHWMPLPEPPK